MGSAQSRSSTSSSRRPSPNRFPPCAGASCPVRVAGAVFLMQPPPNLTQVKALEFSRGTKALFSGLQNAAAQNLPRPATYSDPYGGMVAQPLPGAFYRCGYVCVRARACTSGRLCRCEYVCVCVCACFVCVLCVFVCIRNYSMLAKVGMKPLYSRALSHARAATARTQMRPWRRL